MKGFDDLLKVGDFNSAGIVHRPLRFMAGFMPKHGINPQFTDMGFLISELGGNSMAEGMKRHIFRDANTLFMLRESPSKIVSAFARR